MLKGLIKTTAVILLLAALAFLPVQIFAEETKDVDIYDLPIEENDSLCGRIVFVDPGHGIGCGGAYGGYTEHVYNLIYANLLKDKLEKCGATVVMTRTTAENVDNYHRMAALHIYLLDMLKAIYQNDINLSVSPSEIALLQAHIDEMTRLQRIMKNVLSDISLARIYFNAPYDYSYNRVIHPDLKKIFEYERHPSVSRNVLYVSIHSNATGEPVNTNTNGTVTYYLSNDWYASQNYYTEYANVAGSEIAATLMLDHVSLSGGFKRRGMHVNDYFMLREHNAPAVLVEMGYHTNAGDRERLKDEENQDRITNGMVIAIQEYFSGIDIYTMPVNVNCVSSSVYQIMADSIAGIHPCTTVDALLSGLDSPYYLSVIEANGGSAKIGSELVVTEDELVVSDASTNETIASYPIIIYGDVSGDGQIGLIDLLTIQKYLLGTMDFQSHAMLESADVNKSGEITLIDLLFIQKHLLGEIEIAQ